MKLEATPPKQWMYWAKKAGLKREWGRGRQSTNYLVGRGRRWRVNCFGDFQCSCPIEHFDRWANSLGAEMDGMPKTEAEFLAAVRNLRELSVNAR